MQDVKKSKTIKKNSNTKAKTMHKKQINPDNAHWIQSQAKLMKILQAAGMEPKPHKMMITCHRDR